MGPAQPAWSQAGGLSLPIEVPQEDRELTFSKVGGNPRLTLSVRPRASWDLSFGLAWTIVWLTIGIGLSIAWMRPNAARIVGFHLPKAACALGLIGFLVLAPPVSWIAFALFLISCLVLAFQYRRAEV